MIILGVVTYIETMIILGVVTYIFPHLS